MATNTNSTESQRSNGARNANATQHGAGRRPTRARKPVFDKEHATLWLLTVSLGLGLGAVVRFVETGNPSAASAPTNQLAVQRTQVPGYGNAGSSTVNSNQRVLVLPQRSFRARGATRMS